MCYIPLALVRWQYYKRTGAKWMAEKAAEEGVHCLASGLCFKVVTQVDAAGGKSPRAGDQSKVTYAGTLRTGEAFDSGTTSFAPNQVIKGWTEMLQLMCAGDKVETYIPYDLAYGEHGSPPKIPPNSPLQFEIEIHEVFCEDCKPCDEARKELAEKIAEGAAKKEEL